jgi:hypothetical protein
VGDDSGVFGETCRRWQGKRKNEAIFGADGWGPHEWIGYRSGWNKRTHFGSVTTSVFFGEYVPLVGGQAKKRSQFEPGE